MLLIGATVLLALGWIGMKAQRAAVHRQRAGELTILGVLAWLVLAVLPLPRISLSPLWVVEPPLRAGRAVTHGPDAREAAGSSQGTHAASVPRTGLLPPPAVPVRSLSGDPGTPIAGTDRALLSAFGSPLSAAPLSVAPLAGDGPAPSAERAGWVLAPAQALGSRSSGQDSVGASTLPTVDWARLLATGYAAGLLACVVWLAIGRLLLLRLCWLASRPAPWLAGLLEKVLPPRQRRPRLLVSARSGRALSFGLRRPTIVLPQGVCSPGHAAVLRHLLAHEMAHLRRRDALGQVVFNLAFPVLYFHPLYWRIRSGALLAAEMIADDEAAGRAAKESYVDALVALARERRPRMAALGYHGLFASPSQFYRRMKMLIARKDRLASRCSWRWRLIFPVLGVLAVAALAATLGARPAPAQKSDASPKDSALTKPAPEAPAQEKGKSSRPAVDAPTTAPGQEAAKATPTKAEAATDRYTKSWDFSGATPAQLKRAAEVFKRWAPLAEVSVSERYPAVVVTANSSDHETIRDGVTLFKELLQTKQPLPAASGTPWPAANDPFLQARPTPALPRAASTGSPDGPILPLPPAGSTGSPDGPIWAPRNTLSPAAPSSGPPRGYYGPRATLASPGGRQEPWAVGAPAATPEVGVQFGSGRPVGESSQVDLVALATSYTDAVANLSIAKRQSERLRELHKAATISAEEYEIAEIRLQAAERKVELLRGIAESALKVTKGELEVLKQWHLTGANPAGMGPLPIQIVRAESRMEILQKILAHSAPAASKTPPAGTPKTGCINPPQNLDGAEGVVYQFLEAVRSGDDRKTELMLTKAAREAIEQMNIRVAPRRSHTARFELGAVERVGEGGARVDCKWTDLDPAGIEHTDPITWMLRKEGEGWRITGFTAKVFDSESPLLLDLERPQETLRALERLRQEIAGRAAK